MRRPGTSQTACAFLERGREFQPCGAPRRCKPEQDGRREGDQRRESQNAGIGVYVQRNRRRGVRRQGEQSAAAPESEQQAERTAAKGEERADRKSTRLNSSHL